MKDSFIFEGKKYISSRRASEISDYSSDYIGQLCRAEKLDSRMIGRTWFVTEESIRLHQANILHDEITRNRIENLRGQKQKVAPKNSPTVQKKVPEKVEVVAKASPVLVDAASDNTAKKNEPAASIQTVPLAPVLKASVTVKTEPSKKVSAPLKAPELLLSAPREQSKVPPPIAWKISYVSRDMDYKPDDRPLLPVLKKPLSKQTVPLNVKKDLPKKIWLTIKPDLGEKIVAQSKAVLTSKLAPEVSKTEPAPVSEAKVSVKTTPVLPVKKLKSKVAASKKVDWQHPIPSYPELVRSIILHRALASALAIVLLFSAGRLISYNLPAFRGEIVSKQVGSVSNLASANVHEVMSSALSLLKIGYGNTVAFFTRPLQLATTAKPGGSEIAPVASQAPVVPLAPAADSIGGIAVAPSLGLAGGDEVMKQKIRDSFSDQVEINPDQSGTAGVIKPIFRESKGKDYLYVMVPVKDKDGKVNETAKTN